MFVVGNADLVDVVLIDVHKCLLSVFMFVVYSIMLEFLCAELQLVSCTCKRGTCDSTT
jgi:hypothetical protein